MTKDSPRTPGTAVALQYSGEGAPRVTAKGKGEIAERILAAAKEHRIPIQQDPELAHLLSQVGLGEEIPQALYIAVAEVLAFAYGLSGKSPPIKERPKP